MSNVLIPPPPYQTPFTNQQGVMTPIWAKWFNQIYLRAGGADAPSNGSFASAASVTILQGQVASINSEITTINDELSVLTDDFNGLSVGRQL